MYWNLKEPHVHYTKAICNVPTATAWFLYNVYIFILNICHKSSFLVEKIS